MLGERMSISTLFFLDFASSYGFLEFESNSDAEVNIINNFEQKKNHRYYERFAHLILN